MENATNTASATIKREYYIWLLTVMGAANPRTMRLISHFGDIEKVYEAIDNGDTSLLKPIEKRNLSLTSLEKSLMLISWCEKRGYSIITIDDDEYPEYLKHIYNPPLVLFCEGDISDIKSNLKINVIGTRRPSSYSRRVVFPICSELSKMGMVIVSGMARGIDELAMNAALESGGRVIGVLACGLDIDYPKNTREYRRRASEKGGVFISELLPRDNTHSNYFRERNRIMSGISSGTFIVEAAMRSGCHLTANHTLSQNRDLFCLPPCDILNPRYHGVIRYLRDGAIPVFSHLDIIGEYIDDLSELCKLYDLDEKKGNVNSPVPAENYKIKGNGRYIIGTVKSGNSIANKRGKTTSKSSEGKPTDTAIFKEKPPIKQKTPVKDLSELTSEKAAIVTLLREKALSFDEIFERKFCPDDEITEVLLDLELDEFIEKISGDRYSAI